MTARCTEFVVLTGFASLLLVAVVCCEKSALKHNHVKVERDGEIILSGIFPIFLQNQSSCELLLSYEGLVWSEAMIYAIQRVNANTTNNLTLGYSITDSCKNKHVATKEALRLLNHNDHVFQSRANRSDCSPAVMNLTGPVMALIGAESSEISITEANLVQLADLPQVSYSATSDELSHDYYTSFFRTIPPDRYQSRAIADLVRFFNWTFVSVVGVDDNYGRNGVARFVAEAGERNICIALEEYFPLTSAGYKLQQIVRRLKALETARVVVLYVERQSSYNFLHEVHRQNLTGKIWIGTDGWSDAGFLFENESLFHLIDGMLGVLPHGSGTRGFSEYLKSITPGSTRYGWWSVFWEREFNCSNAWSDVFTQCSHDVGITAEIYESKLTSSKSSFVMDAVEALASVLQTMRLWDNESRVVLSSVTPADLLSAMKRQYTSEFIHQHHPGESLPLYTLTSLQSTGGRMQARTIGTWSDVTGLSLLDPSSIWAGPGVPESICSEPCKPGYWQTRAINCCWECIKCNSVSISTTYSATNCTLCPQLHQANGQRTHCDELPRIVNRWTDPEVIAVLLVHLLLVLATIAIAVIMYRLRHTNLVAPKGYGLDATLLVVLAYNYCVAPVKLLTPTALTCAFDIANFIVAYTLLVALLLGKLLLLYTHTFITGRLVIAFSVFFQTFVITIWFCADLPAPIDLLDESKGIFTTCNESHLQVGKTCKVLSLSYNHLLMLACAVLAYRKRHSLKLFREAKFIGYSMYALLLNTVPVLLVWLYVQGWFIVFFLISVNLLSLTSILGFVYGPKLYILFLHPHRLRERSVSSAQCLPEITVTRSPTRRWAPAITTDRRKRKTVELSVPNLTSEQGIRNEQFHDVVITQGKSVYRKYDR